MHPLVLYALLWLPMILIAIGKAGIRESLMLKPLGEHRAHQLSTLTLILFFTLYTFATTHFWPIETRELAWQIGGIWFVLTNAFEIGMVIGLQRKPWPEFWENHKLWKGNLRLLVPLSMLVLPPVFQGFRRRMIADQNKL